MPRAGFTLCRRGKYWGYWKNCLQSGLRLRLHLRNKMIPGRSESSQLRMSVCFFCQLLVGKATGKPLLHFSDSSKVAITARACYQLLHVLGSLCRGSNGLRRLEVAVILHLGAHAMARGVCKLLSAGKIASPLLVLREDGKSKLCVSNGAMSNVPVLSCDGRRGLRRFVPHVPGASSNDCSGWCRRHCHCLHMA